MAKKTKYVKFRGKAVYLQVYRPDEYNGQEFWKVGLAVTKDGLDEIKATGCQLKPKFADGIPNIDDGTRFITFKRPTEKTYRTGHVNFCPPTIYDRKGKAVVSYHDERGQQVYQYGEDDDRPERKGDPILIGNGSEIEVTVSIYDAGSFGKGTRLESVKIIDLIEYNPPDEEESEPEDDEPPFDVEEKDEITKTEELLNDEIPFGKEDSKPVEPKKKGRSNVEW